ncbi:MAG: efflux RND transporter periplasmic adaptor subunit [Chloracidobacterium sp.]|nr:efflux RND transporter periplasmic adaptor subunit [Chloracidobacterium sp.]
MITKKQFAVLGWIVAAGLGASCSSRNSTGSNSANNQPTIVDITTAQAVTRQIPTYFEATGNLAGDAQTDVAPVIGGKIVEVNFDVGSYVEKGSVLVRLDDRDARLRLEQAEAQVVQQRRAVDTATATLRQAQVRLGLKDGETFDIETFSQVKSTRANLVLAEKELARAERLFATEDVSRSFLDQRRAQRDALIGQLDEARSNAAVAVRAINSAEAQVAAARSGIATAETQVDQARKALTDTAIRAPISGYIAERVADLGEFITPNAPNTKVATIVRTSTLRLKIDVPEQSIGKVETGQGISLQVSAYPDRNFLGTVARILPSLNATARTLTVEAEVPNGEGLLKPGQFATVRIAQSKGENAVMVPAAAVRTEGDLSRVFVVKDGAAREQLVQTGILEGDMLQIKQGIAEGDVIATSAIGELSDGVLVRQVN